MEMMLDKKQIWAIFLFEFKMGCKAVETTHNINNTFGPGTAKEHGGSSGGSRSLCKGDKSLEDEEHSGWQSSKLILLQLHEKFPKNSVSTILWSFTI